MVRKVRVQARPLVTCDPACLLKANREPPPPEAEVAFSYEQLVTHIEERVCVSAVVMALVVSWKGMRPSRSQ